MRRIPVYLAFLACLLGCSKAPSGGPSLHLALETSPNKLDPAFIVDVAEGQIASLVFQGLVRFSPLGKVVPDAASHWEIDETGRRYVFHLDDRMRFSNGRKVVAADVRYSFERVLSPGTASPRGWVLDKIQGARELTEEEATSLAGLTTPDDSTVVVELSEPFGPFLQLLAMPAAAIVPREVVERYGSAFADRPVGSGRWQLARWERGDYIRLTPNPHYPVPPTNLKEIVYRIIPEAFTRIAEFESGALDVLKVPNAELQRFLNDPDRRERIQSQTELRVTYIGLNNGRGALGDARVRRALNMAVDVDRIIDVLTNGRGVRAAGAIPPTLEGFARRRAYPFDPAAARRLLSEAGYGEGFSMEIWQRDSPEGNRVVEAVQGYLRQVGIDVRIVKREWSAFKEAVGQGRVDAFFLDWYADYPDAENFLFPLFHSANAGGGGNRAFFDDLMVDGLIEHAQREIDPSVRRELYERIDSLVYEQAPWIYLYFPTTFVAVSPLVSGYVYPVLYLGEDFFATQKTPKGGS